MTFTRLKWINYGLNSFIRANMFVISWYLDNSWWWNEPISNMQIWSQFFVLWIFWLYVINYLSSDLIFCVLFEKQPDYYHAADQFVRSEGDGSSEYRLTIPCVKLDFTGAYSIIARNAHGEAKAIISLQVYVHGQYPKFYNHPLIINHLSTNNQA